MLFRNMCMLIKVKTRCQSPFHPCLHGHRQTVWLYVRSTFTLHFEFPLWHTWTWPYTKCTLQLLLSLNSSHPSTHGTDKAQSGPLSFTDIYFTLFIDLYVKIIWESVLRHVDLRENLHRTLSSPPLPFFVSHFYFLTRTTLTPALNVELTESWSTRIIELCGYITALGQTNNWCILTGHRKSAFLHDVAWSQINWWLAVSPAWHSELILCQSYFGSGII